MAHKSRWFTVLKNGGSFQQYSRQTLNVYLNIDRVHQIQIYHHYEHDYPLVMTNIAMVFRWPIELDGLPFLKMVIFHGELLK